MDLRKPINLVPKDVAICLEVLEHIKEEYSDIAVGNVCNAGRTLVVSVARPRQAGEHHHTLKPKDWWLEKFAKHGFYPDNSDTMEIFDYLSQGDHTNWIDNIFVLKKGFRMNQKRPIVTVSSPVFSDKAFKESLSKSPLAQLTRKPPAKVVQKQTPATRDALAPLTNHPEEAKQNTPVSTESSIYRSTGTLVIQNKSSASMHSNPSKKRPT